MEPVDLEHAEKREDVVAHGGVATLQAHAAREVLDRGLELGMDAGQESVEADERCTASGAADVALRLEKATKRASLGEGEGRGRRK